MQSYHEKWIWSPTIRPFDIGGLSTRKCVESKTGEADIIMSIILDFDRTYELIIPQRLNWNQGTQTGRKRLMRVSFMYDIKLGMRDTKCSTFSYAMEYPLGYTKDSIFNVVLITLKALGYHHCNFSSNMALFCNLVVGRKNLEHAWEYLSSEEHNKYIRRASILHKRYIWTRTTRSRTYK